MAELPTYAQLSGRVYYRTQKNRMRGLRWLLMAGIAVMLAACGGIDVQWQEQARMAEGEILLLNRTGKGEQHFELGNPGGGGWAKAVMSLEVAELPADWQRPPVWETEYVPILLDYQPSEKLWSLVATFYFCDGWEKLGRPRLPYVEYQSRNGEPWQVVPLEERMIGRNTNLLTGPSSKGEPKLVTVEERDRRNRSAADRFRKIVDKWDSGGCCKCSVKLYEECNCPDLTQGDHHG
jgi:hypothetical protein